MNTSSIVLFFALIVLVSLNSVNATLNKPSSLISNNFSSTSPSKSKLHLGDTKETNYVTKKQSISIEKINSIMGGESAVQRCGF